MDFNFFIHVTRFFISLRASSVILMMLFSGTQPTLIHVIKSDTGREVVGVTALDNSPFLARQSQQTIEVYDMNLLNGLFLVVCNSIR